jgi:predicted ribosome quality control (RQC) complex YloA/Tae2 family protein
MPKQDGAQVKRQLSSFDVCALVAELQPIVGGRLDKVFHYPANPMELQFRLSLRDGKKELRVFVGGWLYVAGGESKRPSETAERLTMFAQTLRRLVTNAKILKIEQHGFDRIIEFTVEQGARNYILVFELFGSGNVILAEQGIIMAVLTTAIMKDRSLKTGVPYSYPPSRTDLRTISRDGFFGMLKAGKNDIVRVLALELNLGGTYAEELCFRAGIDKKASASGLADGDIEKLHTALQYLLEKCSSGGYGEIILNDAGEPVDLQPWSLRIYEKSQKIRTASFNECVSRYADMVGVGAGVDDRLRKELERLKRKLEQQRTAIPEIEAQAEFCRKTADSLYGESERIERALMLLRRSKEKKNIANTVKLLKERGIISDFDSACWSFSIKLKIGGKDESVAIGISKNFHENVSSYYEKAKTAKEKLDGAKSAFQRTLGEIEGVSRKALMGKPEKAAARKGKVHWFEQYRWFISSSGLVVVAGKDAHSNDKLVKRYLREGDRYAHAEVHGAPSVVIRKPEGVEIGEDTLKEACEFALSFSKAWSMKLTHGSAYWVNPEQVSKTPESGEFVPRGGFMIRGKKNIFDVAVQCALGETEYEGDRKLMCGPVGALKARAKRYVVLKPGETEKNSLAKELAVKFGSSTEQLLGLLPPGDGVVTESVGF